MNYGSGTHGARFNCNKELAISQAMVADGRACLAQGQDFGVGGGVMVDNVAIVAAAYYFAIADDYGADGDLSCLEGALGAAKRFLHVEFVRHQVVAASCSAWLRSPR